MLKNYANYFAAYLLNNLKDAKKIDRIILYGSVARDESRKDSDVDIFIEVNKKNKKFENEIKDIGKKFYQSREAALFKSQDIDNKINIKIGILRDWKELYESVASTGIILYGPYEAKEFPSGVKHYIIFFWDRININRGAFLNKIYGFKIKNKYYEGLLIKLDGKKIGKSCIMVPIQYKNQVFKLLKGHKVEAKTIEVFS